MNVFMLVGTGFLISVALIRMRSEVQVLPGPREIFRNSVFRGYGAAGSASALQAEGRRFEPG